MNILFIDTADPSLWESLTGDGHQCTLDNTSSKEEIQAQLHRYDGFVIRSRFKIDRAFIEAGTSLRFIARVGAGLENIDVEYARSKGIRLISAPEGNRQAVGEHAVGMLLTLMRRIALADREVRHGKWIREGNRGDEIQGRTVGIIGYGNMGGAFARCISGFGVETLAYDIKEGDYSDAYARRASMEELFERADIVSLHVPLTESTRGMMDRRFFESFKKPIYVINTARGGCCVTKDLVWALENGRVRGACLDVLEYEKSSFEDFFKGDLPADFSYLVHSPRVVLTPHIAGWTHESNRKMAEAIVRKIRDLNKIETGRLLLRPFTENDTEALFAILSDEEVNTFLPMFPLKNMEEARTFLHSRYLSNNALPDALNYAICLKEDNIPIGYVHISGDDSHDLGYGLRKEFWHKGLCTEACQAILNHLKQNHIPYITATHDIHNPQSGKVMQAIGMKYRYSYEELWQPKNIPVTFRMYQLNLDGQEDRVYRKYWDKYPRHFIEDI